MSLPIIPRAEFVVKHPQLPGGKVTLRPMTVGSENVLLQIKDSKDVEEILTGVKQVLRDCIVDGQPPGTYPLPFVELMFMKVVSKSSGEIRELAYTCKNEVPAKNGDIPENGGAGTQPCNTKVDVKLDLEQVTVVVDPGFANVINISGDIGVKLKMLSLDDASHVKESDDMATMITRHVDCIFEGDKVWTRADVTEADILQFVKSMPLDVREKIANDFFGKMPALKHTLKFKCPSCGHDHSIELESLSDFFG